VLVLVEESTETVVAMDAEPGELVMVGDRFGQWCERPGVGDALMRPVRVVVMRVILSRVWL
jgi:hypothetical protein